MGRSLPFQLEVMGFLLILSGAAYFISDENRADWSSRSQTAMDHIADERPTRRLIQYSRLAFEHPLTLRWLSQMGNKLVFSMVSASALASVALKASQTNRSRMIADSLFSASDAVSDTDSERSFGNRQSRLKGDFCFGGIGS